MDGSYLWSFRPSSADELFVYSPVVGSDGTVYVHAWGPGTNRLYALNPATGVAKWANVLRAQTNNVLDPPPLMWCKGTMALAADGEIYVGDLDGTVYSFAPDRSTNWTYAPNGVSDYYLHSLLIGPDGTLFLGDGGGGGTALTGPLPARLCSLAGIPEK